MRRPRARLAAFLLVLALIAGTLLWTKLKLVAGIPRSVIADPPRDASHAR